MSPALRRSRRSLKASAYSVGDLVEIKRRSRTYTGRLVYRLTEDKESPNPLWLVTFDGQEGEKDEEIYEKHFGAVVKKGKKGGQATAAAAAAAAERRRRTGGRAASQPSSAENGNNVSSSSGDENKSSAGSKRGGRRSAARQQQQPQKQQQQQKDTSEKDGGNKDSPASAAVSDSVAPLLTPRSPERNNNNNSDSGGGRMSAREQRSLRRQAKIDEEAAVRDTRMFGGRKRGFDGSSVGGRNPDVESKRPRNDEEDGEVVKVKLKTGTLYLYKGLHRRAEFVRRY